jgi:protein AATF/BFR2
VAPSVLLPSNRNAFSKNSRQEVKNAVQLIDEAVSDHNEWDKLLNRTRVWRNKGDRMGSRVIQEHDEEVFDDTEFYQQLLRDVIDSKNGGQDWMAAQKERKKKKNVDTKASKGRKLRYAPFAIWVVLAKNSC